MTMPVYVPGMHIDDNGNLVIDADEMDAAGIKSVELVEVEGNMQAEVYQSCGGNTDYLSAAKARIAELEALIGGWATAALKYYPMNGWAFDPTNPMGVIGNIVDYWQQKRDEEHVRITELEAQIRDAGDYAEKLQIECSELEARLKQAEAENIQLSAAVEETVHIAPDDLLFTMRVRAEKAEADAGRLREVLRKVEWRASGAHMVCVSCGGLKRYAGHKDDCVLAAALSPADD